MNNNLEIRKNSFWKEHAYINALCMLVLVWLSSRHCKLLLPSVTYQYRMPERAITNLEVCCA